MNLPGRFRRLPGRFRRLIVPFLWGAALLLIVALPLKNLLDPACRAKQVDHDRRMEQSDRLLTGLSLLTPKQQCDFHVERAALLAEQVQVGQNCIWRGRGPDSRMRTETEARLYHDLAEQCSPP
jgi:hypothetical protein